MPSLEYTKTTGLVQKSDTTDNISLQGQLFGLKNKLETISADKTLLATDSGKVFLCSNADIAISLPRCTTAGITYRFILSADAGNDIEIVQSNDADDFVGTVLDGAGTSVTGGAGNSIVKFAANNGKAGDVIELVASGSRWLISGSSQVANGIVFA